MRKVIEKEDKHISHKFGYSAALALFLSLLESLLTFILFDTSVSFFYVSFIVLFIVLLILFFLFFRFSMIKKVPLKSIEKHNPLFEMKYTLIDMNIKWIYYLQVAFSASVFVASIVSLFMGYVAYSVFFFIFSALMAALFILEDYKLEGLVILTNKGIVIGNSMIRYFFINWHHIEDFEIDSGYCYVHISGLGRMRFPVLNKEKQIGKIMKSHVK